MERRALHSRCVAPQLSPPLLHNHSFPQKGHSLLLPQPGRLTPRVIHKKPGFPFPTTELGLPLPQPQASPQQDHTLPPPPELSTTKPELPPTAALQSLPYSPSLPFLPHLELSPPPLPPPISEALPFLPQLRAPHPPLQFRALPFLPKLRALPSSPASLPPSLPPAPSSPLPPSSSSKPRARAGVRAVCGSRRSGYPIAFCLRCLTRAAAGLCLAVRACGRGSPLRPRSPRSPRPLRPLPLVPSAPLAFRFLAPLRSAPSFRRLVPSFPFVPASSLPSFPRPVVVSFLLRSLGSFFISFHHFVPSFPRPGVVSFPPSPVLLRCSFALSFLRSLAPPSFRSPRSAISFRPSPRPGFVSFPLLSSSRRRLLPPSLSRSFVISFPRSVVISFRHFVPSFPSSRRRSSLPSPRSFALSFLRYLILDIRGYFLPPPFIVLLLLPSFFSFPHSLVASVFRSSGHSFVAISFLRPLFRRLFVFSEFRLVPLASSSISYVPILLSSRSLASPIRSYPNVLGLFLPHYSFLSSCRLLSLLPRSLPYFISPQFIFSLPRFLRLLSPHSLASSIVS
ncbi:hypothetical protein C7M84_000072 [Penaeus vannamei]|uniref:Uncharacterized protein n=1 Tax=Penaeus vannamei TaxID=6689 RepID=A0A3R7N9V2_PENVA|nr:hypothetical protein C7M84_000072 [Penaeus vannamei]